MFEKVNKVSNILFLILGMGLVGCSMIDEDQSDCGDQAKMDYELQLVTNVSTEVQTKLSAETDVALAATVKDYLGNIFTDFAHDVNLSFYAINGDSILLHHDEHIMNDSEHSYTLYIPRQKYMHLAVANVEGDPVVRLEGMEYCHTACLRQIDGDTIDSHNTGIFTARQLMEMFEGIDQTFNVKLYMANCSAMLVVDPNGHDTSGMRVFTTGFATAFFIADSVYEFKTPAPLIRTSRMDPDESGHVGFVSVNFPSREPSESQATEGRPTRSIIETTEPFIALPGDEVLWEFRILMPQEDGSIKETILGIKEPLRAGQLKIVRCRINDEGEIYTDDPTVAVSVKIVWNEGGHHHVPL